MELPQSEAFEKELKSYVHLANYGKLKLPESEHFFKDGLPQQKFEDFVDKMHKMYPAFSKNHLFDNGFVKAARTTNKANIIIKEYNDKFREIFESNPLFDVLTQLLMRTRVESSSPTSTLNRYNFVYDETELNINFEYLFIPSIDNCSMNYDLESNNWCCIYEGTIPFFEITGMHGFCNDFYNVECEIEKHIEKTLDYMRVLSASFTIGKQVPDFPFLLNTEELKVSLDKQLYFFKHKVDKLLELLILLIETLSAAIKFKKITR